MSTAARRLWRARSSLPARCRQLSTQAAVPITTAEFYEHFLRCMPPSGWGKRIAVANSGGPDSVCLLHLLAAVIRERGTHRSDPFPSKVYSVHVNHNLQDANSRMALVAAAQAHRCGVEHCSKEVQWGTPPFPPCPQKDQPMELIARNARASLLYTTLKVLDVKCIAYGHHADDQLETSIMRLARGSKHWGASGMRPIRRWGMGGSLDILPPVEGLSTWVLRPLLGVTKDRILATCEAHGLEYVVDPTNFQPDTSVRNTIRDYLHKRKDDLQNSLDQSDAAVTEQDKKIDAAIQVLCPKPSSLQDLRDAVQNLGKGLDMADVQATNVLNRFVVPSPPSTLVFSADNGVTDPDVQMAIVRRIMRYISPKPWGSLGAVGNARGTNLGAIIRRLWDDSRFEWSQFSVGGEVLWRPVVIGDRGELKLRAPEQDKPFYWLAHRARQPRGQPYKVEIDITSRIADALSIEGTRSWAWIYDNRFLFQFLFRQNSPNSGPSLSEALEKGSIIVRPAKTSLMLPQVVWQREGEDNYILGEYRNPLERASPKWRGVPWIHIDFIRPLTML